MLLKGTTTLFARFHQNNGSLAKGSTHAHLTKDFSTPSLHPINVEINVNPFNQFGGSRASLIRHRGCQGIACVY